MLNLPLIYRESLNIYKNSGQYERDLLLGCNTNIIPISESSIYYEKGIRGIESVLDLESHYSLYVDLSFLFIDCFKSCVSNAFIYVISNDFGIDGGDILYNPNLYFLIDMSNFNYILDVSDTYSFARDKLLNMYDSHINLVYPTSILYISLSPNYVNQLFKDISLLDYLLSYVRDSNFNLVVYGGILSKDFMGYYLEELFSRLSVYPVVINYHFLKSNSSMTYNILGDSGGMKSSVIHTSLPIEYYKSYLSINENLICSSVISGLNGDSWCICEYR